MFIPDPYFYIPDPDSRSRVKKIPDPGSRIRIGFKELSFLTQKVVPKLEEIWSRMFIGSLIWYFTNPGSRIPPRGQKGTRSGIRIHNTEKSYVNSGQYHNLEYFIYFSVNAISVKDHIAVGSELAILEQP
jgi:hypothetical protein